MQAGRATMNGDGKALVDPYGRRISSLRISITHRCNFNCFFCHQEGEHDPHGEATVDEIEAIVATAAEMGISKIKLTGGEPLLREDLVEIVERISPHVDEVSMTTNGYRLDERACALRDAGLRRVNVSLHTADPEKFHEITGYDALGEVRDGILAAVECGLNPVKINMVVMNGVNEGEVQKMIQFSKEVDATLQLIEYQPLERGEENFSQYHYDLRPLEGELERDSEEIVVREMHRRRQYHLKDGAVVEIVRPNHNSEFCRYCTRLRLTSDGQLKPCLMRSDNHVEAVSLLREGGSRQDLADAIREAVARREPFWKDET
ncbi:MAG TPA: GTP 3',8-cyclase MoaA [Patescibacteria group bacterium]|nr:GTP 3',8-cyclase MoaA [Patescibacteria group bacterium]